MGGRDICSETLLSDKIIVIWLNSALKQTEILYHVLFWRVIVLFFLLSILNGITVQY